MDLSDGPTFEAVEAALRYMAVFVQRLEENQGSMLCHERLVFGRLLRSVFEVREGKGQVPGLEIS